VDLEHVGSTRESASEQRELEQPWARETQPSCGQYPPIKFGGPGLLESFTKVQV